MALVLNNGSFDQTNKTLYSLEDFDDDYEFGIDKTNMSIQFVETSTGTILLKNEEMLNPFFVGINGGSLSEIEPRDIYSGFKRVFFMCMKDNFEYSDKLFQITDKIVNSSEFYHIGKQFALVSASLSVIKNYIYRNRGCVIDKIELTKMFGHNNNYHFDLKEIIIPLIEQNETNTKMIVSLYDTPYGIKNISEILEITSHYNKSYKTPISTQIANILETLKESQFWCDPVNCNINMTEDFKTRGFNYREQTEEGVKNIGELKNTEIEDSDKNIERVINILSEGSKKKDLDYTNQIHTSNGFVDIASTLQNSIKRTYYMNVDDSKLEVTKLDVENMISSITDVGELYHTVNSLIVSKDYCHMVLNSSKILDKIQPLFKNYGPVYKLLLGYAWQCFNIEESIMKTKTTKTHRYVFDIHTANKLPVFPFITEDLTQNPYMTLLVDKTMVAANENAVSLYCMENYEDHYGVCTFDQFQRRFNLFTTGDPDKNLFKGINWDHFAISGSIMPACLQKKSPLLNIICSDQNEDNKWLSFFNNYYADSDIDMMCNDESIYGFASKVGNVIEQIKSNTANYKQGDITIEPIKSMLLMVTKHFYKERIDHFNEYFNYDEKLTPEEMMLKIETEEMKEYLYGFYFEHKSKFNALIRKSKKDNNQYIKQFMSVTPINEMKMKEITYDTTKQKDKITDCDMCFYINDFRGPNDKVSESENYLVIKIAENVKFKIKSQKHKTIELFRSKSQDFFGVVGKFHLPCVRSYYQGNNVYILPSCISAMMTGVNIDYKYFAGVHDPIKIINKYRMRGFGILLSEKEKEHMCYYNSNVQSSGGMFFVGSKDEEEIKKMFGPRELTDKIYRPLIYTQNLPPDNYLNPDIKYIKSLSDLKKNYKNKYNYDDEQYGFNLFSIKTVNNHGSINPYKSWVSKEYFVQKNSFDKPVNILIQPIQSGQSIQPIQSGQSIQPIQSGQFEQPNTEKSNNSDDDRPVKISKQKISKISEIANVVGKVEKKEKKEKKEIYEKYEKY